ncbi:leucyl/phenylalanyl-tRNA--protein transferase [Flavobacteriaceae bacterium]|jgi:leucyl/phenylalanyl-tRNA--protein transferase|nr:leucyl/phenylalanyl-tRNA--protein transferase [Flavobacteriaceae bacterium]MDB9769133.1 leucyl/phenylalanyl-tRNA--protein transferase [bacterium]MDB0042641.1 leucyl/phenylalanyl-tRNA--protein transferase [Flavobacteriaceae bacterium]MDB0069026.1 leucyl/phenylalanyl-tRNA--protein transferase [Flavobacteriaceae bacterium]MDB9793305.1 leucyl/phenylalanyl-tRNA--protein transferase [Flavobacteriaceae bacterium]|tara:strand:+ start:155 stop:787 length:633 start_codon:yes stop_codon:yes gene_type:complete
MHQLSSEHIFPSALSANNDGIVAIGGDLDPKRILQAYKQGIFPWFESDDYLVWWSPDPRMVLFPAKLKISKSTKKILKDGSFNVTFNQSFDQVVECCASVKRFGQNGTWITEGLKKAYNLLHKEGHAFSVEVWKDFELVGGLYGIDLGDVFCGESMFSKENNASKIGFIHLIKELTKNGYKLIDCQVPSAHLKSLGAEEISREQFLNFLT